MNGEAAAAWILVATRRPGNPPVLMKPPSRGAWRCKRGRGRSLPLAVRMNRNAGKRGAPKPCSRPLSDTGTPEPPHWTASVKASRALSQHWLRLRPSRVARRRIAHQHSATPRPPRGRDAAPGRGRYMPRLRCEAAARGTRLDALSGSGPVGMPHAESPRRRTRDTPAQVGVRHDRVDRRRRPPIGRARRCARARAGPLPATSCSRPASRSRRRETRRPAMAAGGRRTRTGAGERDRGCFRWSATRRRRSRPRRPSAPGACP